MGLLLVATTLIAYLPAWNGKPIWDDERHITMPELRSVAGLYRIWTQPTSTAQYYPLVHSVFWVEYKLWGNLPLGYHLVNILLHCVSALLLLKILRQLEVPWAWLAAAIFALHPVEVESVAWISELKNTLSGVFYFASALVYLKFDRSRNWKLYAMALGWFILGLLSKTAIAPLPAALLVIFWWKRGKLFWIRDVLPLMPFFLAGMAAGLFTAWVERTIIGAEGQTFNFTLIERFLIAGRAFWFYLGKILWPGHLVFTYRRWNVSGAVWWQYLFPAALLMLLAAAWTLRAQGRGPLAGLLFFAGTLFPALGFFNVYPFRYAFVADHFQYLAGLGVITLVSAGTASLLGQRQLWGRPISNTFCLTLLTTLACLTWRQCGMYTDEETLWRTTISKSPDAFIAYINLGTILAGRGEETAAVPYFEKCLEISPSSFEAHNCLGTVYLHKGQLDKAMEQFKKAVEIGSDSPISHFNLGQAFLRKRQLDEAITQFQETIRLSPDYADAHNSLGIALLRKGQSDEEAINQFQKTLELNPNYIEAHYNLGMVFGVQGRLAEAAEQYRAAIRLNPRQADAHGNLANVLVAQGKPDEAIKEYQRTLNLAPNSDLAHYRYGQALEAQHHYATAKAEYQKALGINPHNTQVSLSLAWLLATCPDDSLRNGEKAVELAEQMKRSTEVESPQMLDTLGAAYAEAGRYGEAVATAKRALDLPATRNNQPLAEAIQTRLKLYEARLPYHEKP